MADEPKMVQLLGYRCERCGHEWLPRNRERPPKVCPYPKCKSPYWHTPRRTMKPKEGATE